MGGVHLVLKLCDLVVQVGCGKCLVKGGLPGCLGGGRASARGRGGGDTHYAVRLLVHAARATRQNPEPAYAGYSYLEDVPGVYRVASYVMAFH